MTQTYLNQQATTAPFASREVSAAGRLRPNADTVEVETPSRKLAGQTDGFATNQGVGGAIGQSSVKDDLILPQLSVEELLGVKYLDNSSVALR